MNLHSTTLPLAPTRMAFKKAVVFLKQGQHHGRLPDDVHRMLKILYNSEGEPRLGFYNLDDKHIEALIFDGKAHTAANYEYPVMLREPHGIYQVYSLMRRPGKPPLTYMVESFEYGPQSWVPKCLI